MARILIAEDEPQLALLYGLVLKKQGHELLAVVSSGSEALEIFKRTTPKPDLVILDHRLENMTGLEVLRELLKMDQSVRILFASADDSVMEDAINSGAIDYIGKPFSMQELLEVISRCLS